MKKIAIIGLLILLVIAVIAIKQSINPKVLEEANNIPSEQQVLTRGTYEIATGTTIIWQGQRPLMNNYKDSGTLTVQSGSITVADGGATGTIVFDMNSIAAETTGKGDGMDMLSNHLKSDAFFDVANYPTATFILQNIAPTDGPNEYVAAGTLTIKGKTNDVSFPVVMYNDGAKLAVQGKAHIDRTLWDVKFGSGKFFQDIGDKVIDDIFTVSMNFSADKK